MKYIEPLILLAICFVLGLVEVVGALNHQPVQVETTMPIMDHTRDSILFTGPGCFAEEHK